MTRIKPIKAALVLGALGLVAAPACGSQDRTLAAARVDGGLAEGGDPFCGSCEGTRYRECSGAGAPVERECFPKECVAGRGCLTCQPGAETCVGNDVHHCGDDGEPGAIVESCDADQGLVCSGGACKTPCEAAADKPSYLGCEFWAVDLDNEYAPGLAGLPPLNDAAGAPWGVALSNVGDVAAIVTVERNAAALGAPADVRSVVSLKIAPHDLAEVPLPTSEVDGSTNGKNDGPGTFLSPNAFRITSTVPIIVYQFNTLRHTFSNDASLLLPTTALGLEHRVVGWPSANPVDVDLGAGTGGPTFDAPPYDHSYVTVVGTQPGTKVTIIAGGDIAPGGPVAATPKGGTFEVTLGTFDVLNLESAVPKLDASDFSKLTGALGTFQPGLGEHTGTVFSASAPVVVFCGSERAVAPMDDTKFPPPGWKSSSAPPQPGEGDGDGSSNGCTTDHIEEQIVPATAVGKTYLATRSPIRSTNHVEPDVVRFMGLAAPASVKTNLPAPDDAFTLAPGQVRDVVTIQDFTVDSSEPVVVAQMLVAQCYSTASVGDSSLSLFPPVDQLRGEYIFLTPTTWTSNYVVIGMPEGTSVQLDGADLPASCVASTVGPLLGTHYVTRRCPVGDGVHRVSADKPVSLMAYGFAPHGSYAYVGGADVKPIYVPPPLK
jgi:hypothetical protein